MFTLATVLSALELGFIYALVALALFLSFRVLNIADMTTDGAFTLGCAVSATAALAGHPVLALPLALLAVAPDWFHYRDRVIELRVLALRKRIWEEYLRDYPLERGSVRVWLVFSLRTGELETVEVMFRKGILEDADSFPAREIIAMGMNSDWSGSTYIMEHEPDKYDNMYTGYLFSPY